MGWTVQRSACRAAAFVAIAAAASALAPGCASKRQPIIDKPCSTNLDLSHNSSSQRAFVPSERRRLDPITLSARVRGLDPETVQLVFDWQGTHRLQLQAQTVGTAVLAPGFPGLQRVTVTVRRLDGASGDAPSDTAWTTLSVPQVVVVSADADFDAILESTFFLAPDKSAFYEAARTALDAFFQDGNIRVVWKAGFGEAIPSQFTAGGFAAGDVVMVQLHGGADDARCHIFDLKAQGVIGIDVGQSNDALEQANVHICPQDLPGAFEGKLNEVMARRADFGAVYEVILARLIARETAHETFHAIFGCTVPGLAGTCHAATGVLAKSFNSSFYDATAIRYTITPSGVDVTDDGVDALVRLPPDFKGALEDLLPLPSTLPEYESCSSGLFCVDDPCPPMTITCYPPAPPTFDGECSLDYDDGCCSINVAVCDPSGCRNTRAGTSVDLSGCPGLGSAMQDYFAETTTQVMLWPGRACGLAGVDGDTCSHICPINICAQCGI